MGYKRLVWCVLGSGTLLFATTARADDPAQSPQPTPAVPSPPPAPPSPSIVYVPVAAPAPAAEPLERRSTGMMATGIALTSVGIAGMIGGGAGLALSVTSHDKEAMKVSGLALGVATLFVASGIPLWAVGGAKERRTSDRASAVPVVAISGAAGSARWRF